MIKPSLDIFLLFSFCLLIAAKLAVPFEEKTKDEMIKCATEVANANFNVRKHTVLLSNEVENQVSDKFLKSFKGTVVIETKRDDAPPRHVVVVIESYISFIRILNVMKPDLKGKTVLTSGAKFLIILLDPVKLERITAIMWSFNAVNVLIITKDGDKIGLYTYYPYRNHTHCHETEPVLMRHWNKNASLKFKAYPNKMKNMHKCPLYVSTNKLYHPTTEKLVPLQMIKKTIVKLLRDQMNFTPMTLMSDYVSIDSDRAKNWSDSLNDVITGLANISTCSIPLGYDRLGLLDYSTPYFRVRLSWLAPPIGPGPVWWRLFTPLNSYLWLVLLCIVFFVTSLPFTLKLRRVKKFCYKHFKNVHKIQGAAFRTWGVMLGQPIRVAPRCFRDFYIISLWIWFTFVVRSAYQSVLIGALKTDPILGNFANLKETVEYGYKFGGRGGILSHFEFDPYISEHFEVIPEASFEQVFTDIVEGRKEFVLATSVEYAWANCLAKGKKEHECGHILPDSILTVPLVIWMKTSSPFVLPLSIWLPRFIESGLLDRETSKKPYTSLTKLSPDPTPLTDHQILSCMLCLLIGYAVSMAVFVMEILRPKTAVIKRHIVVKRTLITDKIVGHRNHRFVH
ncbi:uncharacterized protein LOC125234895 [Leguminivora glycinivorella]|uniref:uncharacterized protein LOC125234895 n=1 Tax=Leguminivora glycinivorella TaxID=1035111 RepID=UPI00200BD40C|nr:uncharacterized protein LOC125234895 [Leguminivora glycinivorella]